MRKREVLRLPTDGFVRDVATNNKLFHDQFGEAYIAIGGKGSEILRLRSCEFMGWLNTYAYSNYSGVIMKNNQATDIKRALEGFALCGEDSKICLEPRVRRIKDEIWYDLGKEAVCVSDKGWKIVKEPPIIFRRYGHQKAQVKPVKGGDIQLFRKFTNITDDSDWNLFLAFAVATLIPDIPKPVLVINGSQGAGKSTPMRMLKDLADPSQLVSAGKITGEKELARLANRHSLLFFDNLSFLEKDNSDVLCRLITGDGFSKRRLYSDDDEVIYNYKRPIMLNGINNFITQADLLDRALILNVERISEDKRLTEVELWGKFEKEKPLILGAMFTVLSKAMQIFPETPTSGLPRMADFGRWGCAIYSAINDKPFTEFQEILSGNKERQIEESIESDPVAIVAKFLASELVRVEFTAYDFFEGVVHHLHNTPRDILHADEHTHWPKDASQVGKRLRRAEGMLKEAKIEISYSVKNNERLIRLTDCSYSHPENVPFYRLFCGSPFLDEDEKLDKELPRRHQLANMTPEECDFELKREEEEKRKKAEKKKLQDEKRRQNRARTRERMIERKVEAGAQIYREAQAKAEAEAKTKAETEKTDNSVVNTELESLEYEECPF